jgi:hypothetical protein
VSAEALALVSSFRGAPSDAVFQALRGDVGATAAATAAGVPKKRKRSTPGVTRPYLEPSHDSEFVRRTMRLVPRFCTWSPVVNVASGVSMTFLAVAAKKTITTFMLQVPAERDTPFRLVSVWPSDVSFTDSTEITCVSFAPCATDSISDVRLAIAQSSGPITIVGFEFDTTTSVLSFVQRCVVPDSNRRAVFAAMWFGARTLAYGRG